MAWLTLSIIAALAAPPQPLGPGNHLRTVDSDGRSRTYLVHVPPQYDPKTPTPVVLSFHGVMTNGAMQARFSGLNRKADEAGFVVVYPYGTGAANLLLAWNAGGIRRRNPPDDAAFVARLLDDLARVVSVDRKRVFATGMSNGGMMCYRLAAELSDRIAAIASVSGTQAIDNPRPKRPVPVMHFHGADDKIVPYHGPDPRLPAVIRFKSVEETIRTWVELNGCPPTPERAPVPDKADDGTTVRRRTYGPGKDGAEVVLYVIEGGGHTWPGRDPPAPFLGKSTQDVSANDLMWEFFRRHPMP